MWPAAGLECIDIFKCVDVPTKTKLANVFKLRTTYVSGLILSRIKIILDNALTVLIATQQWSTQKCSGCFAFNYKKVFDFRMV